MNCYYYRGSMDIDLKLTLVRTDLGHTILYHVNNYVFTRFEICDCMKHI